MIFKFKISTPNSFKIIPIGTIVKEYIKNITTGEIIEPNSSPNLCQIKFGTLNIFGNILPNPKKVKLKNKK